MPTIKIRLILSVVIAIYGFASLCQAQTLITSEGRLTTSLNGYWNYIIDPYENGYYNYRYEPFDQQDNPWASAFFLNSKPKDKTDLIEYDFDKMDSLIVPGDWNTQKSQLFYYEGSLWYKKSFDYEKAKSENRVYIHFGAVNYKAEVYLNGQKLGQHVGGFTPFQFEVTDYLKGNNNFLILKVDNKRTKEGVPTLNTDWWNYGGITRDVKLIETEETFIEDHRFYLADIDKRMISGEVKVKGSRNSNCQLEIFIPELDIKKTYLTDANGICKFQLHPDKLQLWSIDSPKLYDVQIRVGKEIINDKIGFRTIETEGKDILLNGESIFLKGISIHEESPLNLGRAHSMDDAEKLLDWAIELGCNYVRLAHYPHNEYMVRLADKKGLLVWAEIPVYWTIDWDNPMTYKNAENQLSELISRDKNRASVIIWSMANETPTSESRNNFLEKLMIFTRQKDNTRLISAALEQKDVEDDPFTRTISDPFAELVDVLSFNQYIGWYDGNIEKCRKIKWYISHDKPVIVSEFGAGAKFGLHGTKDERWTEEYQEYLYVETLSMIDDIGQLAGVSPWILVDFLSPRRVLPDIQDNYNRKGLLSEKGEKKKAFFILQDYYNSKK